jgi:hypothetical protein
LKLPTLSIAAIVALDHLRGLLLLIRTRVRLATRDILGADHSGGVNLYVAQDIGAGTQ